MFTQPRSLGWRTELIFARFDGEVVARNDHLVIRTRHNPTFRWGNYLLLDRAPAEGDAARWLERFEAEIASGQPESRHVAVGIDSPEPFALPNDFAAAGFSLFSGTVLTMRREQLRAPRTALNAAFRIAAVRLPEDAAAAVELQVACRDAEVHAEADHRLFRERQMRRYEAMVRAGMGEWFAVFARGTGGEVAANLMVADCGLFRMPGERLGRFQHVETHPAWRRQGLCSALVHAVCRHGFDEMALDTLVIVADPHDVAIGLYESIGFERADTLWQLERAPPRSAMNKAAP